MTIVVSISTFRRNIAEYIAKARVGYTVVLQDEKQGEQVAQLVGKKKFDGISFKKALQAAQGVFTAQSHPEWETKEDLGRWMVRERKAMDRKF
jgi:antitoxin (DNA-binding transcriptional repressor) of toxin-antitoxin stability system